MNSYVNMGVGALLGTVFVLMSVSIASEGIFHSAAPEKEGFVIAAAESGAEAADEGGAAEAAATPIATLLASADPAAGEAVFKKCAACHSGEKGGPNKVGPGLWNIVNNPVATHEGFSYSAGMKAFAEGGKVWDYEHLNHFLAAPKKYVAGTAMGFAGLKKDDERANLIAYLRTLADNPAPLPDASAEGAEATPAAEGAAPAATETAPAEGAAPTATETAPAESAAPSATEAAPAEGTAPAATETAPAAQ